MTFPGCWRIISWRHFPFSGIQYTIDLGMKQTSGILRWIFRSGEGYWLTVFPLWMYPTPSSPSKIKPPYERCVYVYAYLIVCMYIKLYQRCDVFICVSYKNIYSIFDMTNCLAYYTLKMLQMFLLMHCALASIFCLKKNWGCKWKRKMEIDTLNSLHVI